MSIQFKPSGEFAKFTSGESLSVGNVVCLGTSDNEVLKADASNSAKMPAIGFVKSLRGSDCIVQLTYLVGLTGLTQGSDYWVSTNGNIINTAPSSGGYIVQKVGRAVSSNKLLINLESQIVFL